MSAKTPIIVAGHARAARRGTFGIRASSISWSRDIRHRPARPKYGSPFPPTPRARLCNSANRRGVRAAILHRFGASLRRSPRAEKTRRPAARSHSCRQRKGLRRFHQRVENSLQIESGAADDLEHVGGRRLLLQRFAQFVEQPRVLDGDDGLGSEVLTSAICLSVKGRTSWRDKVNTPINSFSFSIGTARNVRTPPSSTAATIVGLRST